MALNIPEGLHEITADLFGRETAERKALLDALKTVKPGSSAQVYDQKLEESFPQYPTEWRSEFLRFVFSLTNLSETENDQDKITQDFTSALRDIDSGVIENASPDQLSDFGMFVREIFDAHDTIGLGAKAYRLAAQYEHIYIYSEVFSDIRTIFSDQGPSAPPKAALVSHSLRIHYHDNGDQHRNLFVALDYQDLEQMKNVIERAMEKHKSLSSMIGKFELRYIEPGADAQ